MTARSALKDLRFQDYNQVVDWLKNHTFGYIVLNCQRIYIQFEEFGGWWHYVINENNFIQFIEKGYSSDIQIYR